MIGIFKRTILHTNWEIILCFRDFHWLCLTMKKACAQNNSNAENDIEWLHFGKNVKDNFQWKEMASMMISIMLLL